MFSKAPLRNVDGIPVFSHQDGYAKNYERIAQDHLDYMAAHGESPFMTGQQIVEADRVTRELILGHVRDGSRLLDAGLGLGVLLRPLTQYRRHGVDIALPYLRQARRSGIKVAMAKLEDLPYFDEYFDAVVSTDVLEHVLDLHQVSAELVRVLKPGGILVVRTPNEEALESYLTDDQDYSHSHVRSFSITSLRLHFQKCHDMTYVDHAFAGYRFTIASQLRFPYPELKDPLRALLRTQIATVETEEGTTAQSLLKLLDSSLEEMVDAVLHLQQNNPAVFQEAAPFLLKPQELIGVFRKMEL